MSDPFKLNGPTCISFSGGRTSAYMLWRVLQSNGGHLYDSEVCFANTGKEEEATLRFVAECAAHWKVHINWLEYWDSEDGFKEVDYLNASRNGQPFHMLIRKKSYLPNPVARLCTQSLKVEILKKFCPDMEMMVGIRYDEPRRAAKMPHLLLPLVSAKVTKQEVLEFWKQQPFDLETSIGNCDLCFLKGSNELSSIIRANPDRAIWWAKQEEMIGATFRSDRPSYAAMRKNALNQKDMFGYDETIECFCGD